MIKEEKNIDFYTTGRQPSEHEFAKISEWIKKNNAKKALSETKTFRKTGAMTNKNIAAGKIGTAQHQQ